MPDSPATNLLAEALVFLNGCRIEVTLHPEKGRWHLVVRGARASTDDVISRAIQLGIFGAARMQ